MELSELTAYAKEKYNIEEQHKWADFPGFSVLCHPQTGKWVALLMRQWDTDTGSEIERCDLKCGTQSLREFNRPYLAPPIRMHGSKWVSVAFGPETEPDVVFRLLDRAVSSGEQRGYTIVLGSSLPSADSAYRDTALPFSGSTYQPKKESVPNKLREMRRYYNYGRESLTDKARSFFRQGMFMKDYEDDAPWQGDFVCYFPTYQDMTSRQLRGYFSWRSRVRRGDYQPVAASAAYIYLYELLCGIGTESPEDSLQKLRKFEEGYLDSGFGDQRMRRNLRRWMLEFAVIKNLPPETARQYMDPEVREKDFALAVLKAPDAYSDEEVFSALCVFGPKRLKEFPVITSVAERGMRLFADSWRKAASGYREDGKALFTLCFGEKKMRGWYPLSNAVFYQEEKPKDMDYPLDECRSYRLRNGVWQVEAYEKLSFDRDRFQGFLHEADLLLRRYFRTGRYLKENPRDAWAAPFIEASIQADRQAVLEAARPKITIDLSGLDKIREDAISTRDSLLTEEDLYEPEEYEEVLPEDEEETPADIPLDAVQIRILRALLSGGNASEIMQANRLMPSLVADIINEAMFDEVGDVVLTCEDDRLSLVEEYREDLEQMLGGI